MDKGAHFYHCDFQVHTPRDLQWHANVVQANDVAIGKAKVGERVVVLGGRLVGMEVAIFLTKQSKKVSLVTLHRLGENGRQINVNIYRTLIRRLIDNEVYLYPDSPAIEIRDNGVHV